MRTPMIFCAGLTLLGSACASSQGERVADARMEQVEARADAKDTTVENEAAARQAVIDRGHEQASDNVASANGSSEGADQELVQVSEERAEFQSEAKEKLDKLEVRIEAAQEKLSALGGKAPTALKGELLTTIQQHKMLEQDVIDLQRTAPSSWESATDAIDERIAMLDTRVEELSDEIDDV
jgi:chromosome segregation ATPase